MKISLVGRRVVLSGLADGRTDGSYGQTDRHDEAFRNFASASKNWKTKNERNKYPIRIVTVTSW